MSPFWMTFKQAKEFGAHVRKGERGNLVVYANTITMEDHLKTGDLELLLEPFAKDLPPFYIYYPEQNKRVECLRLLIDFLKVRPK
ncbi:MAG: ArdC-like ssDNA-binding domain-containing protein [Albidovulum sp.]